MDMIPQPETRGFSDQKWARSAFPKLMRSSSHLLLGNGVAAGIGFLNSVMLARWLGVDLYGGLILLTSSAAVVSMFFDVRVQETVVRYVTGYQAQAAPEKSVVILKLSFAISLATGLLAFFLLFWSANWITGSMLHLAGYAKVLIICAAMCIFDSLSEVSAAIAKTFNHFRLLAFYRVLLQALKTVSFLGLWVFGDMNLLNVTIAMLCASALSWIVISGGALHILRRFKPVWKSGIGEIREDLRELGRFLWFTNLNGYLKILQTKIDVLLVGFLVGPAEAGILGLAKSLSANSSLLFNPIGETLYPELSRLWNQRRSAEIRAIIIRVTQTVGTVFLVMLAIYIVFGSSLLRLVYSHGYETAYLPVMVFLIGYLFCFLTIWGHPLLLAHGQPNISNRVFLISVLVQLGVLVALTPKLGAIGAALAFTTFYMAYDVLIIKYVLEKKLL